MKIVATLFALLFSVLLIAQDGKLPIIDMHMHSYPIDYMGESRLPNPVTGRSSGAASDEELMQATLSEMRRYNIVKAVTSGPLKVLYRWKSEAPACILGGVYFDEVTSLPDVEQLREQFIEGRLGVLGELVAQHVGLPVHLTHQVCLQ